MKKIYIISLCIISLIACTDDFEKQRLQRTFSILSEEDEFLLGQGIPIASIEDLMVIDHDDSYHYDGYLNYRFARDYAFAEFIANISNYYPLEIRTDLELPDITTHVEDIRFASHPVVVYDYDDNPYYYEFPIIYQEDMIIGTVTVAAQPRAKELIEFMFPSPITYNEFSFDYRRYVGEYPLVYFGTSGNYNVMKWGMSGEEFLLQPISPTNTTTDLNLLLEEKILSLSSEEIYNIEIDLTDTEIFDDTEQSYPSLSSYVDSYITSINIQNYWDSITHVSISCNNSEFTISQQILTWINENIQEVQASYVGFLSEYRSNYLRLTSWDDYCGPSIMSWLYRGKYNSFNGKYIALYGDSILYNNAYYDYDYPYVHPFGDQLVYKMSPDSHESNTYETRENHSTPTDGGLYYNFFQETTEIAGEYPLYDAGLRAGLLRATQGAYKIKFITTPISWIRDMHQPVVVEGIHGHLHYWGAIGYAYNENSCGTKYNLHLFVMDNGAYTAEHNNYPYWSILGGLNYAWKENY